MATLARKRDIEPVNNVFIGECAGDPSVSPGLVAGVGSRVVQIDSSPAGDQFNKTGTGNTDWTRVFEASAPAEAGAAEGAAVTATEVIGTVRKTTLTLTDVEVALSAVSTARGFGGTKIYEFPEGRILFLGCMAALTISVPTADQADFAATPEGDVGIGSVIAANADAIGTDATDDDFATGVAFDMAAGFTDDIVLQSEPVGQFNGTATPVDVNVNVIVDAADIDDDSSPSVTVTGTVVLHWINLGDV